MLHRTQFGPMYAIGPDLLNLLTGLGWEDVSYGNDVCPSFELVRQGETFLLFVDTKDRAERELPWASRFTLCRASPVDGHSLDVVWSHEHEDDMMRRLLGWGAPACLK